MKPPDRIPLSSLTDSSPAGRSLLHEIAAKVSRGALFIYPTETIYGIGGSITADSVRDKIYRAKSRGAGAPLIIIAAARKFLSPLSLVFPPAAEALAKAFWPGNITLILPSAVAPDGIGVRISDHPFIAMLSRYCRDSLYSTSANISGQPYRNDPEIIYSQFVEVIDFMVDAGPLPESAPSSVVKVREDNSVEVVREGVVSAKNIFACLA